ncbi:MAG: thiol oxidoreductase, partial [Alphaproteobacteria bacterium]
MKRFIWAQIVIFLLLLPNAYAAEMPRHAFEPISGPIGGDTTQQTRGSNSFALPSTNINRKDLRVFFFGNKLFNTNWVIAPASVRKLDGLGPTFNRVSCSSCHLRDGRGHPPEKYGDEMLSMLVRLSIPGKNDVGGPKPHPAYGNQLNDRAIPGVPAEGRVLIKTHEKSGKFADGTPYTLSVPTYEFTKLAFGPLGDDIMFSPRVAPAVIGLGLLSAIPEKDILAKADPDDKDGDGISGRVNHVWDQPEHKIMLGRFGWKAGMATVK